MAIGTDDLEHRRNSGDGGICAIKEEFFCLLIKERFKYVYVTILSTWKNDTTVWKV